MPKILVADDSIAVRKVAERLLTEAGLDVSLAAGADEAIALLANERPDLVVSDVIMPDKSGYEVCSFVRAQESLSNTPVLLLSNIVNEEVTRQAESCRADGVLKKPFQGSSLKDMVLQLLAKREHRATPKPAAASTGSPAVPAPEGAKAFRITEEQLQMFRQAVTRMTELEELLTAEREKSAQLAQRCTKTEEQLQASRQAASHMTELEELLTAEREKSAQLAQRCTKTEEQLQASRQAASHMTELEEQLAAERKRSAELAQRYTELEHLAARVKEAEAALDCERESSAQLVEWLTEREKAAARTNARVEELSRKLAEIARLSS